MSDGAKGWRVELRVLVVEDDVKLARFITQGFEAEQYAVDWVADAPGGNSKAAERDYDLLILDLRLPGGNGYDILRSVRDRGCGVMVIVLSACGTVEDRVRGLELGADDYLAKPFSFLELRARVRALFRRREAGVRDLVVGTLRLNPLRREAARGATIIALAPREYDLLAYFMSNPDQTLTRAMLADKVWRLSFDPGTNVIDVYVNYVRRKVGPDAIKSVRGVGYYLDSGALAVADERSAY